MASMFNVLAVRAQIKYNYHRRRSSLSGMSLATQSIFEAVVIKAIISRISPSLVVSDFSSAFDFLHLKWLEVAQFIHISRDLFVPFCAFSWFYYLRLLFSAPRLCTICATSPWDIWFVLIFIAYSMPYDCLYAHDGSKIATMMCQRMNRRSEGEDKKRRQKFKHGFLGCIQKSPWRRQWNAAQHLSPAEYLCWWWQT